MAEKDGTMRRRTLALVALGALCIRSGRTIRHWYLRWGATDEELARPMPMDEHAPSPNLNSTMAITIDAPPEKVWPWLVQIGEPPRAGYYSYTFIERLVGLDVVNRDTIMPEFQTVHVGQALDKGGTMCVLAVDPGHSLVVGPPAGSPVRSTWAFELYPHGKGATRLVSRVHGAWNYRDLLRNTNPLTWPMYLLIEPGAFIMERKMLREIRRLAEQHRCASE
jgi:hypothetical protein